jgi:4'-phosphopantetheinyl transferase
MPLILPDNEVHVWRASLDQLPPTIESFRHLLDADERPRADSFHFQSDREHFIVAHGLLRVILGSYLNRLPNSLSFQRGSYGKPASIPDPFNDAIRFNLSHSHGMALYAIARSREVGIDVEFIRCGVHEDQIAERFFSRREIATLRMLPAALRSRAFFLCWTRKEAYIKARGEGLSLPLDQFDVSLTPGEPAELLGTRPDALEKARWSLSDLSFGLPGYAAALAVEGDAPSLALWQWPSSTSFGLTL